MSTELFFYYSHLLKEFWFPIGPSQNVFYLSLTTGKADDTEDLPYFTAFPIALNTFSGAKSSHIW
jgi:hypothetical protein